MNQKFIIQFLLYVQYRFGVLGLFIPGLVLLHLSEITYLGLLVKFSNHILVMNQVPMIKRFLTLLDLKTPSLDVKNFTRDFDHRRESKLL